MRNTVRHFIELLIVIIVATICATEVFFGLSQLFGSRQSNHILYAVTGSYMNPGPYGGFLAVCISLLTAFCVLEKTLCQINTLNRIVYDMALVVAIASICFLPLTQSRSAVFALSISMLLLCLKSKAITDKYNKYLKKYTLGIVLVAISFIAIAYVIKKPSADGRFFIDKICVKAICENGFWGSGSNSFGGRYSEIQADYFKQQIDERGKDELDWSVINEHERLIADCPEYAFNEYLQIGIERGPVVMLLCLFFIVFAIVSSLNRRTIWCYGLVALSLFAVFSYPFHLIQLKIILLLLLIISIIDNIPEQLNKRLISFFLATLPLSLLIIIARDAINNNNQLVESVWGQVEYWYNNRHYDYVSEDGDTLLPFLRNNPKFLYIYGYSLNQVGAFDKSDSILELCASIRCESKIWTIMGDNSLALGNYRKAEERYKHAFYMVPNRMRPLYSLAKLYHLEGDTIRFLKMAEAVESFKPKIESFETSCFRSEIRDLKNGYMEKMYRDQN